MIKVIIIDDEKKNLEYLKNLIVDNFADIHVAGTAQSAIEGFKIINSLKPDLVFLDIQMPGGSGFEFLESLTEINFEVIFVTAFDRYALNAIKFSALDYLLKPVNKADLEVAINKARLKASQKAENLRLRNLIDNSSRSKPRRLALASSGRIEFIPVEEILRCQGESNYTRFFLSGKKEMLVSQTLGDYESMLRELGFFRVHQSHLVNLEHVESFIRGDGGYLLMKDKSTVPVSKSKREALLERFLSKKRG